MNSSCASFTSGRLYILYHESDFTKLRPNLSSESQNLLGRMIVQGRVRPEADRQQQVVTLLSVDPSSSTFLDYSQARGK